MKLINTATEYLILDAELANPTPDRRISHNWTKAEHYPAGIYKLVTDTYEITLSDGTIIETLDRYITTVGTLDGRRSPASPRLNERDMAAEFELLRQSLRGLCSSSQGDRKALYIRTLLDQHSLEDNDLVEILGRVMVAYKVPLGKLDAIMSDYLLELLKADKEVN